MKRCCLENGVIAFPWHNRSDPRGYVPPPGYAAQADLIEHHLATGRFFGESRWWVFLRRFHDDTP